MKKKPDFQKHAENEFRFLVERFGLTSKYLVSEDKSYSERSVERVQYTSLDVMIEVSYSGRGELDVTLDDNPPSHSFPLSSFLRAVHPEALRGQTRVWTSWGSWGKGGGCRVN
jgi:hypothetical protein